MRSAIRIRVDRRDACAASAGGTNWVTSVRIVAGIASWSSFAAAIEAWIARSRSTGSSRSVWMGTTAPVTRFVNSPASPGCRTEIGTMATSGATGSTSRSAR